MFEVKDKNDKTLWIKDKITHTKQVGPEDVTITGIIVCFPDETTVQYEPVGEGLPVICDGSEVVQVDSLAQRAMQLRNEEDFQVLIADATERYHNAVANTKKKKAGTRGGTTKKKEVMSKQAIADLGIDLDAL